MVTAPLVDHITSRNGTRHATLPEVFAAQRSATAASRRKKRERQSSQAEAIESLLDPRLLRAVHAAKEKGASNWLTCLPLSDFGFSLSKSEFRDAIHLRYGWRPPKLPSTCVCGSPFSIDHALSCSRGGYLGIRHNEIRDLLGDLLNETCHNVCLEPQLQDPANVTLPASANTAPEARVDVKAGGFWNAANRHECAFFDVRVFHPHAYSYRHRTIQQLHRQHEAEKRAQYDGRIRQVERGSFTPLVFSTSGGAGPAAATFLKILATKLADKKNSSYSSTISWLRCRLSFALLRSSILCLRGSRQLKATQGSELTPEVRQPDLAVAESRLCSI